MNPISLNAYRKAYTFARDAHEGQKIIGSSRPYTDHLEATYGYAMRAVKYDHTLDETFVGTLALLHDTLGDTAVTYADIASAFGEKVARGVAALTKPEITSNGSTDKSARMYQSICAIKASEREVGVVKLADRAANLSLPFPDSWGRARRGRYTYESVMIVDDLGHLSPYLAGVIHGMCDLKTQQNSDGG